MVKRTADEGLHYVNSDQAEDDEDDDEMGDFRKASADAMGKREIKTAKRRKLNKSRNAGSDTAALKGFSFGAVNSPAVPFSSAPQISATSGDPNKTAPPKVRFSEVASTPSYSPTAATAVTTSGLTSLGCNAMNSSAGMKSNEPDSEFRENLRCLNESVLRWISEHVIRNPYCLLMPVFVDYENYLTELVSQYMAVGAPSTPTVSDFSFGSSSFAPTSTFASTGFGVGFVSSDTKSSDSTLPTPMDVVPTASSTAGSSSGLGSTMSTGIQSGSMFGIPSSKDVGSTPESKGFSLNSVGPCKYPCVPSSSGFGVKSSNDAAAAGISTPASAGFSSNSVATTTGFGSFTNPCVPSSSGFGVKSSNDAAAAGSSTPASAGSSSNSVATITGFGSFTNPCVPSSSGFGVKSSNDAAAASSSTPASARSSSNSVATTTGFGSFTNPCVPSSSGFDIKSSNDAASAAAAAATAAISTPASAGSSLNSVATTDGFGSCMNPCVSSSSGFGIKSSNDAAGAAAAAAAAAAARSTPASAGFSLNSAATTTGFGSCMNPCVPSSSGFGIKSSNDAAAARSTPASAGFSLNSAAPTTGFGSFTNPCTSSAPGFSLPVGVQSSKDVAAAPSAGFSFGQPTVATSITPTSSFASSTKPSEGLSTGTSKAVSFGGSLFASDSSTPAGFVFCCSSPSASSKENGATMQGTSGSDEADYVPPKAEAVIRNEEGAIYSILCKLFFKIDGEYQDRGYANLYLKRCGEKTQLLVRAANPLGTVLLNINLTKDIPTVRQGKNVILVCVLNPPLNDKDPNDKTPISTLLRVKTEKEAEALLKQIADNKV